MEDFWDFAGWDGSHSSVVGMRRARMLCGRANNSRPPEGAENRHFLRKTPFHTTEEKGRIFPRILYYFRIRKGRNWAREFAIKILRREMGPGGGRFHPLSSLPSQLPGRTIDWANGNRAVSLLSISLTNLNLPSIACYSLTNYGILLLNRKSRATPGNESTESADQIPNKRVSSILSVRMTY